MMITLDRFGGMRPLLEPALLDPDDAAYAHAVVLGPGALQPQNMPVQVATLSKAGTVVSLFYLVSVWLHWITDVDVVRSPVAQATNRIYYTGDGIPKATDFTLATTGVGTDYPLSWYKLGIDKPAAPGSLTVGGGSGTQETRSYVYTFVSGWSEEGPPSDPITQTGFINGTWNFNGMSTTNPANSNVLTKRIYRTVTAADGTATYLFVAEVSLATANYADALAATALGEDLPSAGWVAPDAGMKGLQSLPGGILAGFSGNEVCFSEPYQPHAWPAAYRIPLDFPIVGLGVSNSNLVVPTTGTPYIITGSDPANMSVTKIDAKEPCISKRGIVDFGFGVAYPSPNGLVIVSTQGTALVTEQIITRDQWQSMIGYSTYLSVSPTITAAKYRGKYLFFSDAGDVTSRFGIFDKSGKPCFYFGGFMADRGLTLAKGIFVNQEFEDQVYYVDDEKRVWLYGYPNPTLDEAYQLDYQPIAFVANYMGATWYSKTTRLPKSVVFNYVRVDADFGGAHPAYLERDNRQATNMDIRAATDKSPIAAQSLAETAIAGGSSLPLFTPAFSVVPWTEQQGYVFITVFADNSDGRHAGSLEMDNVIAQQWIPNGAPVALDFGASSVSGGKFDSWRIGVTTTARVRRVQIAESAAEFQEA